LSTRHARGETLHRREEDCRLQEHFSFILQLFAGCLQPVAVIDHEGRFLGGNDAFAALTGYSDEELRGRTEAALTPPEWREATAHILEELCRTGLAQRYEKEILRQDGTRVPVEILAHRVAVGTGDAYLTILLLKDITKEKEAERALRESEERYRSLVDLSPDGIVVHSEGRVVFANKAAARLLGAASPEELVGLPVLAIVHPDYREAVKARIEQVKNSEAVPALPPVRQKLLRVDGTAVDVEVAASRLIYAGKVAVQAVIRDITERQRNEEKLANFSRQLQAIIDSSSDLIFLKDKDFRYVVANKEHEKLFKVKIEEIIGKTDFDFMPPEVAKGCRESDLAALNSGDPVRREEYVGDRCFHIVKQRVADANGNILGIAGVIRDITELKRVEKGIIHSLAKLERTLEGTVNALATMAEKRDPYTAGHQRRVAQLACAVAAEMGLPPDQIAGLRVAGMLHDIGKIYVPAEILSKPGRISEYEFSIIKTHPEVGYDIVKEIEFPWPVAQIILQHHERLDGSGYPVGLRDKEILLEAKILAVADVVEAMSSHRPYRPALGTAAALAEITTKSGLLYDPAVVAVCLRLFTEKGFRLA